MEYGNQFSVTKTFYEWCLENNRMDLAERFDVDKNGCTASDIGYQSNKKYWFKCPRNIHDSEEFYLTVLIRNTSTSGRCRKCASLAQVVIDKYGENYLWQHWSEANDISPWDIYAHNVHDKVLFQCDKYKYHVYAQVPASFIKGIGCPFCINREVHPLDSLAAKYPEVIDRWSTKNVKTPYEYSPHSTSKVWFICPNGKHEDYIQTISNATNYGFTCRKCETEKYGKEHRGSNSHSWRGGRTSEQKVLRKRVEYNTWRDNVYARDDYTCQCCGQRGGRLNAHHIFSFANYEDMRYEIDNGITLCEDCHDATKEGSFHNIYGTHNKTPYELREYILNKSGKDIFETYPQILQLTTQN